MAYGAAAKRERTTGDANAKVWHAARDEAAERHERYREWREAVEERLDHAAGDYGWVRVDDATTRDARVLMYEQDDGDGRLEVHIVALDASEAARREYARASHTIWYGDIDGQVDAIVWRFARGARH